MADSRDYPWLKVTFMLILVQWTLALALPSGESAWLKYVAIALFAIWLPLEFLPFWHLKRYGEVPEGADYMSTTRVVDRGIYAIVRHPQFVAWLFFSAGWMLITQHWASTLAGVAALTTELLNIRDADKVCMRDLGPDYARYRERVPLMNVAAGLWRKFGPGHTPVHG